MTRRKPARTNEQADHAGTLTNVIAAAHAASGRKALNLVVLNLAEISPVADYFLICSAGSGRQAKAIADAIEERLVKSGVRTSHIEGLEEMSWVLMDYGDFVVHIFTDEARSYYRLDSLWCDAPSIEIPPEKELPESPTT